MKNATAAVLAGFEEREERGIDTCTTCPRLCRWSCPVAEAEARETSSPWNLVTLGGFVRRGLTAPQSAGDLPYHCSDCGACTEACLHKNDVPFLVELSRARALVAQASPPAIAEVRGHFAVAANAYGTALEPALDAVIAAAGASPRAQEPGDAALYLPGCATLKERPEAASALLKTLALRGVGGVVVTDASSGCCGLPLLWAGDVAGFRAHAERYALSLASAKEIVVHDSACAQTLTRRYADFGVTLSPKVTPLVSFLAERLGVGPERGAPPPDGATKAAPVAYLDTCQLARGDGRGYTPRRRIERATGEAPCELSGLRGRSADCCGAGGLLPKTAPETARAMAEARLSAFNAGGAKELCVGTPRCAAHLARVAPSAPIVDLSTVLSRLT